MVQFNKKILWTVVTMSGLIANSGDSTSNELIVTEALPTLTFPTETKLPEQPAKLVSPRNYHFAGTVDLFGENENLWDYSLLSYAISPIVGAINLTEKLLVGGIYYGSQVKGLVSPHLFLFPRYLVAGGTYYGHKISGYVLDPIFNHIKPTFDDLRGF